MAAHECNASDTRGCFQDLLGFRFSRYRTVSPRYNIDLTANTFTYLTDPPRFRAQVNLQLSFEVIGNLNASLAVQNSYDSRPPTADATTNDISITSSLGYSF